METLIWKPETLHFQDTVFDAWVVRAPRSPVLELKMDSLPPTLAEDTALILRSPPAVQGAAAGHSPAGASPVEPTEPDIELWKIDDLGSFESIRFAKATFNALDDKYLLEGPDSLEAIIEMLSEVFAEGDFRLVYASGDVLLFQLTDADAHVTAKLRTVLDELNSRFFAGPPMSAADRRRPDLFAIGNTESATRVPTEVFIWEQEKLHFRNATLDASVILSPRTSALESKMDALRPMLATDTALILRAPPAIQGDVIGHSPTGRPLFDWIFADQELWKIQGLGSFDSIRLAKAVFNAPDDENFIEGPDSLETIIAMLSEGFKEGDFKLHQVCGSFLSFELTKPNAKVTREQYALLDKLKQRFFKGPHIKAARLGVPNIFLIGSVGDGD